MKMYMFIYNVATPKLTFRPEHPFIGNDITFTCNSVVHLCPRNISSDLSFKFLGNDRGDTNKNTLTIHALAKSDKGIQISCQAIDDLGKVFYLSDTVTLDPYCKCFILVEQNNEKTLKPSTCVAFLVYITMTYKSLTNQYKHYMIKATIRNYFKITSFFFIQS